MKIDYDGLLMEPHGSFFIFLTQFYDSFFESSGLLAEGNGNHIFFQILI